MNKKNCGTMIAILSETTLSNCTAVLYVVLKIFKILKNYFLDFFRQRFLYINVKFLYRQRHFYCEQITKKATSRPPFKFNPNTEKSNYRRMLLHNCRYIVLQDYLQQYQLLMWPLFLEEVYLLLKLQSLY